MKTIKTLFQNLIEKNHQFTDGSIVQYKQGCLKVFPNKNTNLELHGKIHIFSEDDIIIESKKNLKLRGDPVHFNDDKPVETESLEDHPLIDNIEHINEEY